VRFALGEFAFKLITLRRAIGLRRGIVESFLRKLVLNQPKA